MWVDPACIRQSEDTANEAEKDRQLELMGEIFSSAATVFLWLGEGSPEPGKVMHHLAPGGLLPSPSTRRSAADQLSTGQYMAFSLALSRRWHAAAFRYKPYSVGLEEIFG